MMLGNGLSARMGQTQPRKAVMHFQVRMASRLEAN